jgi:hypothetical protein
VVDLSLPDTELSTLPEPNHDRDILESLQDEDEVQDITDDMPRPHLSLTIPGSAPNSNQLFHRKNIPPPLVLHAPSIEGLSSSELMIPSPALSSGERDSGERDRSSTDTDPGSSRLAYLESSDEDLINKEQESLPPRSPLEDKRSGVCYDELDLGLEPSMEVRFYLP